jgi:pyruvate,water dikinase
LLTLDELVAEDLDTLRRTIGGKAARLVWLRRNGFLVPETWVLPHVAFSATLRLLSPASEPRSLLRAALGREIYARVADARQEILAAKLPSQLTDELSELWQRHGRHAPWGLAVRSSATCEDGALVSMAGLADSVIGVRGGADALIDAVRHVWASIASERVIAYLATNGIRDVGMAVVIQPTVEARAAGVMFTQANSNPKSQRQRIVNASVGLGSIVVDGATTPDMLLLATDGSVVESTIARKSRALVVGSSGVEEATVEHPDAPALPPSALKAIADVATRLEKLEDVPWDVEFAWDGENVWVVQARHVTGRGFPAGGNASTVWSRCNVGEALPGVATPFTWSIAGAYSEEGFRKAFGTLGCTVPKNARLVASVYGRFYLNLSEFMAIASQVPWLSPRTLVELGGGGGGEELATQTNASSHRRFAARLPFTITRLVREQRNLDASVSSFEQDVANAFRLHEALDLRILPDEGIARKLRDVQDLLERAGDLMLTCASSSLGAHLVLKSLVTHLCGPSDAAEIVNDLTSTIEDLESAEPALEVKRIVASAKNEPEACAVLSMQDATMNALSEGPTKRLLVDFLKRYGDRAVREAELATPRWKEDPRPVFAMIRASLQADTFERRPPRSQHAEQNVHLQLKWGASALVRPVVVHAQKAARRRERMRTWVTRVLGLLRDVALEADRRVLRLMPELANDRDELRTSRQDEPQAVFFLKIEELLNALYVSRTDLVPLVRSRRAEYLRDKARPDPPPTFTGAPPSVQLPPSGGAVRKGIGASSGIVTGRVHVMLSSAEVGDLRPGEILVVRTSDVGWTPLFCIAGAVVTELGGPLSHAAVVARELGVPVVVNLEGATLAFKTGDLVRVDGGRGTVERLDAS